MEAGSKVLYVDFPNFSSSLLESLNQQRLEGKFCDISIQVQGKVFQAHRAVLAASSPYFHDQVLFRNASRLSLPGAMDARAFENILASCYAGRLAVTPADIVNYRTVGSCLQMWHVVDKCTALLREREPPPAPGPRNPSSQSPSSSNYFSPRDEAPVSVSVKPDQGDEMLEDELLEDGEVDPEQKVTSNQGASGGGVLSARQPRHGGWVLVKEEGEEEEEEGEEEEEEDDDLVLTCEEDDHHFVKSAGGCRPSDPRALSISGVCTLTRPQPPPLPLGPPGEDEPADFCGSTEDFPYEEGPQCFAPAPSILLLPGGGVGSGSGLQELRHGAAGAVDPAGGGPGSLSSGGGKVFACHCGKSFTHRSQRDRHVNMHLNLRPFACTLCNKKFKMKHHLVEHMKIHTGHKPFQCHVCAKKFMWRDSFLRHRAACEKLQHDIPLSRSLD
ncbi:zinc finger and BTB domain-containing protein 22-like [Leucoraja erinacea]|uniref:zinc finger and BTB domain-containing protein 22-like n=1 Tax=Leucoraja erinaceus TaxID=7782 RepID=UPI0024588FA3|nr:zinc finger and BTB domain-containing protein 22-like [Leucoraja erinacea]